MCGVLRKILALCLGLSAPAAAFRVRKARKTVAKSGPGVVSGLWPFAAPGSASPGLVNPNGACWPGIRLWSCKKQWFGTEIDTVVTVAGTIGYRHPVMQGLEGDLKKWSFKPLTCKADSQNLPRGLPKSNLHDLAGYVRLGQRAGDPGLAEAALAMNVSQIRSPAEVANVLEQHGFQLLGDAYHPGQDVNGGAQSSYLIKNPKTGRCFVTFEGTTSTQSWVSNLDGTRDHFCGLVDRDEKCKEEGSTPCSVKRPGGSFVHRGFRNMLRWMIRNETWQTNIRSRLSSCAEVHATGHSLGGALAELFTACIARAPQPGEYGYDEDYKFMSW